MIIVLVGVEKSIKDVVYKHKNIFNPNKWAPVIKEQFESEMIESGYADSVDTIRYEKLLVFNNYGFYSVYAELDGVEYNIVNVNVKTGDYNGL